MEFVGRLSAFSVADILQWVANDRRTGVLLVRSGERERWVSFHQGRIVGSVGENPEELYTRFLLNHGYTDPQTVVAALSHGKRKGRPLGHALVELGILDAETVRRTLAEHIRDSVCGLFLWTDGSFFFEAQEVQDVDPEPAPIDTVGLIMEGSRWFDEYQRICGVFVHENVLLRRGPTWPVRDLSPVQQRIIAGMTQSTTLSGLYGEIKGSYFRFLEAVHQLTEQAVLEIGGWSAREGEESRGREASEVGTAEHQPPLLSRELLGALARVFPRLYPVWLERPEVEEAGERRDELARLLREIDGSVPVVQICIGDSVQRRRALELLLDHLHRGHLALFPKPLAEVRAGEEGGEESKPRRWWKRG